MIDPALTKLMRMLGNAALRQVWRLVKKPAGAIACLFMVGMISFGALPSLVMAITQENQTQSVFGDLLAVCIPVMMYMMAATLVATNSGDGLLELKPPELQFVLAGPFSDSHILSYRLLTLLTGWIPLSAFFALFLLPHFGSYIGAFLGILLGGVFITSLAFQFTLVKPRMRPQVLSLVRLVALFSIAGIAIETSYRAVNTDQPYSATMIAGLVSEGWFASICGMVFQPFASVLTDQVGVSMLLNILVCLSLIIAVLTSCYLSNAGFSELAVEGVARRRKKIERIKSGNVYGVGTKRADRKQVIPAFGWYGGAGPIVWSQITSASRRTGRLVPGVFAIGVVAAVSAAILLRVFPDLIPVEQRAIAVPIAVGASLYIGFLVSMTAQTGFSASPRLLTWYQLLPVRPVAIGVGMMSGTVALFLAIQVSVCLPAFFITSQTFVQSASIFFAGTALGVSFASVSNLVSASTNLRPLPQGTPDIFQGGRAMIYMLALCLAMIPCILFGIGSAGFFGAVLGFSWTTCAFGAGFGVLAILPLFWWYSGERFVQRELLA